MNPGPILRGQFRTDLRARSAYSEGAGIYRIIPSAVAVPVDHDDLVAMLDWARSTRVPLVIRGAGSAMGGGNVGDGVIVDLTAMTPRRLDIDGEARVAIASAPVTLTQLEQAAAPLGLRLPPDPSSARWATVGGAFSTNAAGPRTLRYGAMRRWVQGATILTGNGDRLVATRGRPVEGAAAERFANRVAPVIRERAQLIRARFPRTAKNSSGYALDAWLDTGDLVDLFIGSEGTLGIVEEVSWRLDPIPPYRASMQVEVPALDRIAETIAAMQVTGPSVCELLDRTFLDVVRGGGVTGGHPVPEADVVLLLEYEADSAAGLDAKLDHASRTAASTGAIARRGRTASEEAAIWALRHAASPILARLPASQRSMQVVEDGCVPVARLAEYLRLLREAAARRGLPVVLFGHAGDGHVHANLLPDTTRAGWSDEVASLLDEVSAGVISLGGTLAGEHGDGRLRAGFMGALYGEELLQLFRMVKECFDPLGILNPGVILPARADDAPLSRLKVGASAAAIPDDIAQALRSIEREGGYGRSRLDLADMATTTHDPRPTTQP